MRRRFLKSEVSLYTPSTPLTKQVHVRPQGGGSSVSRGGGGSTKRPDIVSKLALPPGSRPSSSSSFCFITLKPRVD